MFEVELDIFSGRPNPRWTLDAAEESELIIRLLDRSVPMGPIAITEGKLGYRGFVVRASGPTADALAAYGLPSAFRVRDGVASTIDLAAEQWLLMSGSAGGLDPATAARAAEGSALRCRKPYHTSTTDFSDWNGSWCGLNNCYNYGANWRTDNFAQPGYGSGATYEDITVPEIIRASVSDGFRLDCDGKKNHVIKVWFCLIEHGDFHWYRQTKPVDGEERWCHKMGGSPARNTDDSGNPITDPRTADRGWYTTEGIYLYSRGRACKNVAGWLAPLAEVA